MTNEELNNIIANVDTSKFSDIAAAISESVNQFIEYFTKAFQSAAVAVSIILNNSAALIKPLLNTDVIVIASFENHRVRDLALYHRKSRVRKKNLSRIEREIKLKEKRRKSK